MSTNWIAMNKSCPFLLVWHFSQQQGILESTAVLQECHAIKVIVYLLFMLFPLAHQALFLFQWRKGNLISRWMINEFINLFGYLLFTAICEWLSSLFSQADNSSLPHWALSELSPNGQKQFMISAATQLAMTSALWIFNHILYHAN